MTITSRESLHNAIRSRFAAQVATPQSLTTLYDNDPREAPDDGIWALVTVLPNDSQQAEFGSSDTYRTIGVLTVSLFAPIRQGDRDLLQLADIIVTAFRGVTAAGVLYRTPRLTRVGRSGERWYQINVDCPWQADEVV